MTRSLQYISAICQVALLLVAFASEVAAQSGTTDPDCRLPDAGAYSAGDPIYDDVQRISAFFAAKLGHTLRRPIQVFGDYSLPNLPADPHGGQLLAVAFPLKPLPDSGGTGPREWTCETRDRGIDLNTCGVFLSVNVTVASRLELLSSLAHEVFHCFQMDIAGIDEPFRLPPWITEGTASFAGEDYVELGTPLTAERWDTYLGDQKSIIDADYDAMGFFFHLKNQGADVYRIIRNALLSGSSTFALLNIRNDAGDRAISLWPTSLARRPDYGPEWEMTGPEITSTSRPIGQALVLDSSPFRLDTDAGEQKLVELSYPDRQVLQLNIAGYGGLYWNPETPGLGTTLFAGSSGGRYCAVDTCRCNDGSLPEGITEIHGAATDDFPRVLIGLSGAETGASLRATVTDFECPDEPSPSCAFLVLSEDEISTSDAASCGSTSRALPTCLIGNWRQDSGAYVAEMLKNLPAGASVQEAQNNTTLAISSDGISQACIDFHTKISIPGNLPIQTETTGTGASIVKLGLVDDSTLCSVPIKEEFEAFARANIGGMVSEQTVTLTGIFAATSRFRCNGNVLTIVTPIAGYGEVTAMFQRIR